MFIINPYTSGVSYSPEAQAYFDVVNARGGTISTIRKVLIAQGIDYLVTEGQWSLIDRLCIYKNTSQIAALTSMKNPTSAIAIAVNSPTFSPESQYIFDGSTQYIRTQFVASTDAVAMTLNNGFMGCYLNTYQSGSGTRINMGVFDGTQCLLFFAGLSLNYSEIRINSLNGAVAANRALMDVGNAFGWNNGANGGARIGGFESGANYVANVPLSFCTKEIYIGAHNVNGVVSNFFFAGPQKFHIIGNGSIDRVKMDFALNNYFL